MVIRRVRLEIPDLAALGLPAPVERLAEEERGLLLVTGSRGAGKTTTVAALLDRINHRRSCHILTIEDPIEVIHPRSEEHTSELQSLMRNSYAVFCLKKKTQKQTYNTKQ